MSIYKDCDVRGIYPREITAAEVCKIGRALATMRPGTFLVGGDVRVSTPELKKALIDGLQASGADIVDLGTIPTPALYFAMNRFPGAAGATVTASHNPPEYNGIKFMLDAMPVKPDTVQRVQEIVSTQSYCDACGTIRSYDIVSDYIAFLSERFHAAKPLRILVDAGNGAMSAIAPTVLRQVGYEVIELSCVPDGNFPSRSPNPSDFKNLVNTCEVMRTVDADFCAAFDGDGDRVIFIDNNARPVTVDKTLVLLIRDALKDAPSSVVYDQKTSSVVKKTTLELGGTPIPERSGHAFIKRRFLGNGSALAGEVSGHYFFRELGYDDGLFAALKIAEIVAASGKTLAELADGIVCPPVTPDIRIPCAYAKQQECLDCAEKTAASAGAEISHLDGVRAEFPDGWFLLRKSVTAEEVTLRVEAKTSERLQELMEFVRDLLPEGMRAYVHA